MTSIDLEKYVAVVAESTFCPDCGKNPVLLCEKAIECTSLASFYLCSCGFLGQVGVRAICHGEPDNQ